MTPQELDALKQLIANHEQNATGADVAYSNANPTIEAPAMPDPAAPYKAQAGAYRAQANKLDTESQTPYPQPQNLKERIVAGLQAGMQDFGRLGALGGSTGQEELRRKHFDDENAVRATKIRDLRNQAQQQEDTGQRTTYEGGTLDVNRGQLALGQQTEGRLQQAADNPVGNDIPYGATRVFTDPHTAKEVGSRIEGSTKPPNRGNFQRDTMVINGNPEDVLVDVDPDSPTSQHVFLNGQDVTGKTSHYEKPVAPGMQILQGTNGPNGEPSYIRAAKNGPEGPVQVNGNTVGLKPAEAPTQIKNQADSAHITQKMIGVVRNLVQSQPDMTGPAVGRINELALRFGADPDGFLSAITGAPIGTGPAATLSGHLAYLFLNEARATMPGRPAKDYMDFVKSRSAQMSQNPQILEGFLQSAENNARIIKDTARTLGYDLDAKEKSVNAPRSGGGPSTAEEYLKSIGH